VASSRGIDISGHLSRALRADTIERADLILCMARRHVDSVLAESPSAEGKTFLLARFADGSGVEVPDPMGGTRADYETACDMIENYLKQALPRILESAGEEQQ
jgi:protein-tyrosine-phosphatase